VRFTGRVSGGRCAREKLQRPGFVLVGHSGRAREHLQARTDEVRHGSFTRASRDAFRNPLLPGRDPRQPRWRPGTDAKGVWSGSRPRPACGRPPSASPIWWWRVRARSGRSVRGANRDLRGCPQARVATNPFRRWRLSGDSPERVSDPPTGDREAGNIAALMASSRHPTVPLVGGALARKSGRVRPFGSPFPRTPALSSSPVRIYLSNLTSLGRVLFRTKPLCERHMETTLGYEAAFAWSLI